jgi:hypothetical protein
LTQNKYWLGTPKIICLGPAVSRPLWELTSPARYEFPRISAQEPVATAFQRIIPQIHCLSTHSLIAIAPENLPLLKGNPGANVTSVSGSGMRFFDIRGIASLKKFSAFKFQLLG